MKMYCDTKSIRIVGQGWEVRRKLQTILKDSPHMPLAQWLNCQVNARHTLPLKPRSYRKPGHHLTIVPSSKS